VRELRRRVGGEEWRGARVKYGGAGWDTLEESILGLLVG
jgi:hypothetical protein